MARSHKIVGFLFVVLLGAYGCAKGPGSSASTGNSPTGTAKVQKLEDDYRGALAARDQYRQKLAAAEEQAKQKQAHLEQQLEQARAAAAAERDALKAEVKARAGERDALQAQYEGFRNTLRELVGTADTAVGKLNLPAVAPQPRATAMTVPGQ